MNLQQYCQFIEENYTPFNPDLYTLEEDFFVPAFLAAIRNTSAEGRQRVCQEVHPGVFAFDMFRPQFCEALLEEVACFETWCSRSELSVIRPNSMNNYGAVLDTFGFQPFLQQLMLEYVTPLAASYYRDAGGASLDRHHGFVVEYEQGKDVSLDFHVDASDVTLNVCLGKQFTGGELFFRGVRCGKCQETPPRPEEEFGYEHVPGRAVLHRGKHRHGAKPIKSGQRSNLILWCNSSTYDEQEEPATCPPWCGWRPAGR